MNRNSSIIQVMGVGELSNYLPGKPSIQTIYSWVRKGLIPYYGDAKILFRTEEVEGWLALVPTKKLK